ncbi:hypothetical protein HMPREF3291_08645 [Bacillus sp. HMSC76G11]|nr:hypothetical protein HMPREF3291_08645 [Bacillus sp. HMSC76G11]
MIKSTKWIKNERTYTLEDTAGNLLVTLEDRTCNGNFLTEEMLQKYEAEYFEELGKDVLL